MKESLSFLFFALLLLLVASSNSIYAQHNDTIKNVVKKKSDLYLRAPSVVPGTLPEMRHASYWISKMNNPNKVVLSLNEIKSRNTAYQQRMLNLSNLDSVVTQRIEKQLKNRPGLLASIPNIHSMTKAELVDFTKQIIQSGTDYLRSREFGNIMAIAYSEEELAVIENEISYDSNKTLFIPKTGIVSSQSRLHIIPPVKPEYIGLFTNGKARWDLWTLDVLPIGTTVEVLYISKTGAFLFVLSERGYGWVASEEIAIGSKSEIDSFNSASNFIICSGDRVPFYTDSDCKLVSGWLLMGDRLPIFSIDERCVKIPNRSSKGEFNVQKAWLKPDADVNVGYLPYTQKNVAEQAFKLLDNLYDWTGAWFGRNHATNIRDVFRSFGFQLPANGSLIAAFSEKANTIKPSIGREQQFKTIFSNEPFLTIQICENSHSQLYMGNHNDMPIGFDAHGYSYKDDEGNDLELKRWVVGNIEMPDYFLEQEITFIKLY
jgi:hypothetical protein